MVMTKIESLTKAQEDEMPAWANKWIDIGLSTEPADFDAATEAALKAYELCNLNKPMVVLRMSSPYAATLGGIFAWQLLRAFNKNQVGDQVWAQVWDQVGDQVRAQVGDQVGDQVRDQVGAQVGAQVWAQVWAQVGAQVWAQVGDQVRDQVGAQVWAQVGDQVGAQVRDQVWAQVGAQVRAQVGAQVRAQVGDQVRDQVGDQVRDQVGDQVGDQVRVRVWAQVRAGVYNDGISALWCDFTAFATFFRDVCGWGDAEILAKLEINETLVKSCGWTWWHENVLAISDRPKSINRDAEGMIHSESGASIEYRDGWALYHWHGVSIPKEWVTGSPPTAKQALNWENIEQRRAACEILGWENILLELNAKVIDKDVDEEIGTLLEVDLPDSGKERFLQVKCGTGRVFALPVPPEMKTALEANSWTYELDKYTYKPEIRT